MNYFGRIVLYLVFFLPFVAIAQQPDSSAIKKPLFDSNQVSHQNLQTPQTDTIILVAAPVKVVNHYDSAIQFLIAKNPFINSNSAIPQQIQLRKTESRDYLFYLIVGMLLLLACLRFFYSKYFNNLFRVFFNSSLRQSQLTDQLLQARLPSLFFNVFFVISTGFFVYLLLKYFHWLEDSALWWTFLPGCIAVVGIIYGAKYFTLKFTGWITSYKDSIDTYIFVIFLINKIIGILLVPIVVLMAFSEYWVVRIVVVPALIITGLLILLRFFRSYGLLQGRLKVSRFHFLLYVIGIEVLPILMIYKGLMLYLNKSI